MRFRKRPVEVDAVQWNGGNLDEISTFTGQALGELGVTPRGEITIFTLEGRLTANVGDWVLEGVEGEHWPVREDIFPRLYEHIRTYPHERPAGGLRSDDEL